jgi:hypothetical protein
MEVAGLVLGAVPLILYALDNYGRAWKPAKDFYYWKDVIPEIKRDIFLQKVQLSATLANLDLTDPTMDEVEMALQKQCPDKCEQFMDILKQMDNLVNEVMRDLGLDEKGQVRYPQMQPSRCVATRLLMRFSQSGQFQQREGSNGNGIE